MRTGDLLIERAMIRRKQTAFPGTLQYVYSSVPALSYTDEAGNSARPSYPAVPRLAGAASTASRSPTGPTATPTSR